MDREVWQATVHGVVKVEHDLATKLLPQRFTHDYSTWNNLQTFIKLSNWKNHNISQPNVETNCVILIQWK